MAKAVIEGGLTVSDIGRDEILAIKRALTIPNPKHAAAMKYGRYGYTSIPPTLSYCSDANVEGQAVVRIPVGFDVASLGIRLDSVDDLRSEREVNYPRFRLKLREVQSEAYRAFDEANDGSGLLPVGLVQMPTGLGKSVLGLYAAAMFRQRTLVLVHKNDLLDGWRQDIEVCFGGEADTGLIQGKARKIGDHVTLAMVQTLSRLAESDLEALSREFGLVIVDEAHHIGAASYDLLGKFAARYKLGLTATPERSDGLTPIMGFFLGGFAYRHRHGKKDGDILPVEVVLRQSAFRFSPCVNRKTGAVENLYVENGGEAQTLRSEEWLVTLESMRRSLRPEIRYHAIDKAVLGSDTYMREVRADILAEFRAGANCIAFFSQKAMLERFYDSLASLVGERNVQKFYGDSSEPDEAVKARAESGEARITLATYSKGTEGTNVKAWDTAFLVSSINSEKNVEQAVGRIRRTKDGKRAAAKVYDYRHPHVYGWKHHGHTRDARYLKLKFKLPGQKRYARGYSD